MRQLGMTILGHLLWPRLARLRMAPARNFRRRVPSRWRCSVSEGMRMGASSSRLPSSQRERRKHRARASSLSVLRWPLRAMGVMRKLWAPAATSSRWSTKAEAAAFLHAEDLEPFGDPLADLRHELSRVNLRGA